MSTISAGTTTTTALVETGDTTGNLVLQVNGTTPALTLNATQALGVGSSPSYGTSGQVLTSGGTSASPTWTTPSSGAMSLISTLTASASASLTWTGLTAQYYKINFDKLITSSSTNFYLQFGYGSTPTWITSGYNWIGLYNDGTSLYPKLNSSASGTDLTLGNFTSFATGGGNFTNGFVDFATTASTNNMIISYATDGVPVYLSGSPATSQTITAIRMITASGTITSGKASLYGISS